MMAPLLPENFKRKSWKDLNTKISITKREITKADPFIKKTKKLQFITDEENQKSLLWKTEH